MTTGFSAEPVTHAPVRACPSCSQRAVRYPVETIRLETPVAVKPAFAEVQELRCIRCSQRCMRFHVATANVPAATEYWKAAYFYGEAASPPEPVQCFILRQESFPALPRAWSLEERHAAAGLVHRHSFPAQALDPGKRLRDAGQRRLAVLWPLVVMFWEIAMGRPPSRVLALNGGASSDRDSNSGKR